MMAYSLMTFRAWNTKGCMCCYPVNVPDPIHIRSGSAEKRWPEAGRIILAHRLASGLDPFLDKP